MVIRPSGVWNSRAPFHNFLLDHRQQNRTYHLLTATVWRLRYEAAKPANAAKPLRRFFQSRDCGLGVERAVYGLRLSFPRAPGGEVAQPTVVELLPELDQALYEIRQSAIINYVSLFETFVQCWALNYLLAGLEAGAQWTSEERSLALLLSPVHTNGPPPAWPKIVRGISIAADRLQVLPHVSRDPSTGEETFAPASPALNALTAMLFWRDFRNLVVHRGNVVSAEFLRRHSVLFEELRQPYREYLGPLKQGVRLRFPDALFRAVVTTHYKAALLLSEMLEELSGGRRGHLFAPKAKIEDVRLDGTERPNPLLLEGDHLPSLEWLARFERADPPPAH